MFQQLVSWVWWVNVLTVRFVGLYRLFGHFGVPIFLAFLWSRQFSLAYQCLLAAAGVAWLVWTFVATPLWLRRAMLGLFLVAVALGGGLLLHGFLYPPTAQATCPNYAKFRYAARMMNESLCLPIAPLPPPHGGPLHSSWGHLPYVNSRAYLQQLSKYACDLPSSSALVVWGPKSTGKSRGLQELAQLWSEQGRVVIDVDLKDLVGGYDSFVHYFRSRLRACHICSGHLRNKTTAAAAPLRTSSAPSGFLSCWLSDYGLEGTASFADAAGAEWLRNHDTYLQFFFATTDAALGVDFQGFIEFLELLAAQRPQTGPVVILRELQYLNHIGGDALLSDILRTLESKKQGRSLVGVIIETSEYTWVEATNVLRSRESFQPYLVGYMEREPTRKELVDVLQVFSPVEFDEVWGATKGHAGSLNMVFKYVRAGIPLAQAIETARTFTFEMLHASLQKAPAALGCEEELERLRQRGWVLQEKGPLSNPALHFLIEHNILFVFKRTTVVPQHEMMRWAIDAFLSLPPAPTPAVP